jgi:hypothetical protein
MSLDEAIAQQIGLGVKDPLEIARKLEALHGADWMTAELAAHREAIVSEIARQWLGRERRAATLPAVLSGERKTKRETMLAPLFIPGEGWKSLGECTESDFEAREQFYVRAAGSMLRWASWCRACIDAMRNQHVETFGRLKGPLPELPEAEAA